VHAYGARTHHARAPHPNPPLPLVITPPSPPSSPTRARGGGGCGGGRSRHVASRRMERGAPQRHQPPETVGLPKYPPDQTNRVWRVARDGVSALARGGRRSFSPTREGRTGEWAGGQAGRRAGGRAGGTMVGHGQTSERAGAGPWREMYMRASFAPSPPCDDGRLPCCTCHHTTCLGALWYQTQTRSPRWVLGSEKTPHNPSSITPYPDCRVCARLGVVFVELYHFAGSRGRSIH